MIRCASLALILASPFGLAGCANSYRIERSTNLQVQPTALLAPGEKVLVTLPPDGAYGAKQYAGSGAATQSAVIACLASRDIDAIRGQRCEDIDAALIMGRQSNAAWVVLPLIHNWEDRATEWSGLPDRLRIQLRTIRVDAHAASDSTTLDASSKWLTFGGDHPQDMLMPLLSPWADEIVRSSRTAPPSAPRE